MKDAYYKHIEKIRSKAGSKNEKAVNKSHRTHRKKHVPASPSGTSQNKMNWSRKLFNQNAVEQAHISFYDKSQMQAKNLERAINAHREFPSFGSIMPTTPSTSKRSSNDCEEKSSRKVQPPAPAPQTTLSKGIGRLIFRVFPHSFSSQPKI